jgi:hypothetical protein
MNNLSQDPASPLTFTVHQEPELQIIKHEMPLALTWVQIFVELLVIVGSTVKLGLYIFTVDNTPDELLVVWGLYFVYTSYKVVYQFLLIHYLVNPKKVTLAMYERIMSNIKACFVIDSALSVGIYYLLEYLGKDQPENVQVLVEKLQIVLFVRSGVQTLHRLYVAFLKFNGKE